MTLDVCYKRFGAPMSCEISKILCEISDFKYFLSIHKFFKVALICRCGLWTV